MQFHFIFEFDSLDELLLLFRNGEHIDAEIRGNLSVRPDAESTQVESSVNFYPVQRLKT